MRCLRLLAVSLGFCAALSQVACTKETNNYYAAPEPTTSALGFVSIVDEFGNTSRRNDGVTVTVKDTEPLIQAVSDTNGRYLLNGLRAGNYLLTYAKPGYGAYEQEFMLAAAGGNQPVLVQQQGPWGVQTRQYVYQQSATVASNLQVTINPLAVYDFDTAVTISGTLSPSGTLAHPRMVGIAFDTVHWVSKDELIFGFLADGDPATGYFQLAFTRYDLAEYYQRYFIFRPGQRYYVRAYGSPSGGPQGYLSRVTGRPIYSSFSVQASNRADFVVPQ